MLAKVVKLLQRSFSKDAVLQTTYLDDNIVRGRVFSYGLVYTFEDTNPIYFSSEIPPDTLNAAFLLPIRIATTAGYVILRIYEDTGYAGGTQVYADNRNRESAITAQSIIKLGPAGSSKGTELKFLVLSGTDTRGVSVGGGAAGGSNAIIINRSKKYLYELTPSEICTMEVNAEFAEL